MIILLTFIGSDEGMDEVYFCNEIGKRNIKCSRRNVNGRVQSHPYLDARITDAAVRTPWRPVQLARAAPFHSHRQSLDVNVSVKRRVKVCVSNLVVVC